MPQPVIVMKCIILKLLLRLDVLKLLKVDL